MFVGTGNLGNPQNSHSLVSGNPYLDCPQKCKQTKSPSAKALGLFYRQVKLVAATAAGVAAVAVPIEDKENEDNDPDVGVVKNVAEASHGINILPVSFKRSVLPPFDTILCRQSYAVTAATVGIYAFLKNSHYNMENRFQMCYNRPIENKKLISQSRNK